MTGIPRNNNGPLVPVNGVVRPSQRTELVRAAADGELTAADEQAVRDHLAAHPEDRAVIEFERGLRRAIAASAASAPSQEFRERVLRLTASQAPAAGSAATAPGPIPIRPSWFAKRTIRWMAIAASLAVVAGATYFAVRPGRMLPAEGQLIAEPYRVSLVSFVSGQHEECELHADMVGSKLKVTSLGEVPAAFVNVLGKEPDLGRLAESGLKFLGAGPCAVPGRGRSVHMVFEDVSKREPGGRLLVSVFVQQDRGELRIESDRTYRLVSQDGAASAVPPEIYVWKKDGFIYFLASASESAREAARLALRMPEPSDRL